MLIFLELKTHFGNVLRQSVARATRYGVISSMWSSHFLITMRISFHKRKLQFPRFPDKFELFSKIQDGGHVGGHFK